MQGRSRPESAKVNQHRTAATAQRLRRVDPPLVDDIRLLGRLLGEVIHNQKGAAAYETVERMRLLAVTFRRDADPQADQVLKQLLKDLSDDQTVSVIRAFTYFSHLASLAEDRHHIRRRLARERAGDTQEGSIEVALARLRWNGVSPRSIRHRFPYIDRSLAPPAGRAHAALPQRAGRRPGAARHPPVHQRDRRRPAQYRLITFVST